MLVVLFPFLLQAQGSGAGISFVSMAGRIAMPDSQAYHLPGEARLKMGGLEQLVMNRKAGRVVLGLTKQGRPVQAFYFPGTSQKNALVIGGMHGSELSSIAVAEEIIELLSDGVVPYYNVIIVPSLFPDNAALAMTARSKTNLGRYTTPSAADPNRQMPALGKAFDHSHPYDLHGREMEQENQWLIQMIQSYNPTRIANLHAIKDPSKAGIYADPRTDCRGHALGFSSDSSLAVDMAGFIQAHGGSVPGNGIGCKPTALYYNDPPAAPAGSIQKRNLQGSPLPNNRGFGVSLGSWASTGICEGGNSGYSRHAIRLITIEFPGYKGPDFFSAGEERNACLSNIRLYALSVASMFLSAKYEE